MADPYVRTPPVNVGACSATWYVDPLTEPRPGSDGSNPTFGQPFPDGIGGVTGAWQFLVPGPLKDVVTREFLLNPTMELDCTQAWAAAGGEVSVMGRTDDGQCVYGATARMIRNSPMGATTQQMMFSIEYDYTLYPALVTPIRWVVKLSVAHSVTQ